MFLVRHPAGRAPSLQCDAGHYPNYKVACDCHILEGPKTLALGFRRLALAPGFGDRLSVCGIHTVHLDGYRTHSESGFSLKYRRGHVVDLPDSLWYMSLAELEEFPVPYYRDPCFCEKISRHAGCGGFVNKEKREGYACWLCGQSSPANQGFPNYACQDVDFNEAVALGFSYAQRFDNLDLDGSPQFDPEDEMWRKAAEAKRIAHIKFTHAPVWSELFLKYNEMHLLVAEIVAFGGREQLAKLFDLVGLKRTPDVVLKVHKRVRRFKTTYLNKVTVFTTDEPPPASSKYSFGSAVSAVVKRPRGRRGGKHVRHTIPGHCWEKTFMRKHRSNLPNLAYPEARDLLALHVSMGSHPINRLLFVGNYGIHVVPDSSWNSMRQWNIMVAAGDLFRFVGAEEFPEFLEDSCAANLHEGIAELHQFVHEHLYFETQEEVVKEVDVLVKGRGDCWKKIPGFWKGDDWEMTAEKLAERLEEIEDDFGDNFVCIKSSWQADGDLHIEHCNAHTRYGCPCAKDPEQRSQREFIDFLLANKKRQVSSMEDSAIDLETDVLVGKKVLDKVTAAMQTISSPETRNAIERQMLVPIGDMIGESRKYCPYLVPEENQHFAEALGIPYSTTGSTHLHPIHASIRRITYMRELPKLIKCDTTCVSMKEEHFNMLQSAVDQLHGQGTYKLTLVNPVNDIKDISRFAGNGSIPEGVWFLPAVTTPGVWFDESGHYLTPAFMLELRRRNPSVVSVGYSSIFPLISLEFEQSPTPTLYDYRVIKGKKNTTPQLVYWPEGDTGNCYTQPYDPTMILAKSFESEGGGVKFSGGVVFRLLNTRLHMFSAFHVLGTQHHVDTEYEYIKLPKVFRNQPDIGVVRKDHFIKLFEYAQVMAVDKNENYWGKWRLFMDDKGMHFPIGDVQWIIDVAVECKRLSKTPTMATRDYDGVLSYLNYATFGFLQKKWHKRFVMKYAERRRAMISQKDTVTIYPALAVVAKFSHDLQLYSIKWEIEGVGSGRSWWQKMKYWLVVNGFYPNNEKMVDFNSDPDCFPFRANTWWEQKTYGLAKIQKSQAEAFKAVYEPKPNPPEPEVPILIETPEPVLVEIPRVLVPVQSDAMSLGGSSINTQPTSQIEISAEEIRADLYIGETSTTEVDILGMSSDEVAIFNDLDRNATSLARKAIITDIKRRMAIRAGKRPVRDVEILPITVEEGPVEIELLADKNVDEDVHMETEEEREAQAKALVLSVDKDVPTRIAKPRRFKQVTVSYDQRQLAWESKRKELSKVQSLHSDLSGGGMWDALFSKTVSKRYSNIPYRDVAVYPNTRYPDNDCLLVALAEILQETCEVIYFRMQRAFKRAAIQHLEALNEELIWPVACFYGVTIIVRDGAHERFYGIKNGFTGVINYKDGHYTSEEPVRLPLQITSHNHVQPLRASKILNQLRLWEAVSERSWTPNLVLAQKLVRAIRSGEIGLLGNVYNMEKIESWNNMVDLGFRENPLSIFVVMGDPGCRKSTRPQKLMRQYRSVGSWQFIAPTNAIAQDYRDKLDATTPDKNGKKMFGDMVMTWEKALASGPTSEFLILDENKYPPGYVDLFVTLYPNIRAILFLGDTWQSNWHWPTETSLNREISQLHDLSQYSKGYIVGTWRAAGLTAAFWRMPSYSKKWGHWAFADEIPTQWTDLKQHFQHCNERELVDMWQERLEILGSHWETMKAEEFRNSEARSYSGAIGVTVPFAIIEVNVGALRGGDPRLIYTAMTRSENILFVKSWAHNGANDRSEANHPVFRVLRHYRLSYVPGQNLHFNPEASVSIREATNDPLPDEWVVWMAGPYEKCTNFDLIKHWWPVESWENYIDPDAKRGGARLSRVEESYVDAPQFQPYIDETPEFFPEESHLQEVGPEFVNPGTALPAASRGAFEEQYNASRMERFDAEKYSPGSGTYTEQFPDTYRPLFNSAERLREQVDKAPGRNRREKMAYVLSRLRKVADTDEDFTKSNSPILQWAAYQRSDDKASYLLAKEQRLRKSTLEMNQLNYDRQKAFGDACWESFRVYMGWSTPVPWDEIRYHQAIEKFQFRRGDRAESLKKSSLNRADPDFNIMITLKQQWKIKDVEFKPAKPPQPVWIHPDSQLFAEGPYGLLLLELILEHKPPWWHFHAKQSEDQFAAWVQANLAGETVYEMSDQTGQDQAAQGWAVRVFENLMRFFSFPEHVIEEFKASKLLKTLDGRVVMAIMTDSGEVWTFLINTISSTARECFMYQIPPMWPMANGGDDTMRKPRYGLNPVYVRSFKAIDPCEDKRYYSSVGDFTSYMVKDGVLAKNPIILLKRFLIKVARGEGENVALGYFEMWHRNYCLRDRLYDMFDEEQMEAHAILTRIFFNLRKEGIKTKMPFSLEHERDGDFAPTINKFEYDSLLQAAGEASELAQGFSPSSMPYKSASDVFGLFLMGFAEEA